MQEKTNTLLTNQPLGTIATVTQDGKPEAATVAFWHSPDLKKFVIGTTDTSRKAQNIANNGRVSFVVTDSETRCTVQLDGTARLVADDETNLVDEYYKKLPFLSSLRNSEGRCHFVIEPRWMRFTDITTTPWTMTEVDL